MKSILTLLALLVATVPAFAGPLGGGGGNRPAPTGSHLANAKAKARSAAENHTAGQNMSDQQKANVQKLQSDLASIKAGSTVTEAQKQAVKDSLTALADGAVKPSEESVIALADSLTTALADEDLTPQEKIQIANSVEAVLTSANISQAEVEALVASTQALLVASGVTREEARTVADDLRAIGIELRANATAAATQAQSQAATAQAKAATAKTAAKENAAALRAKVEAAKAARSSGN